MAQPNKVSFNLTDDEKKKFKNAIEVLKELLPKLETLSPDERRELPKMGEKTVSFVLRALEYCSQNPEFVPQYLDVNEFKKDVDLVVELRALEQPLRQLVDAIEDSMMLSGSEAYQGGLLYYSSVRTAMKMKVPQSETIYDDLSSRFPGRGKGDRK